MINDGSTDKSSTILSKYTEINNVMIINQENRGLSGARNRGLERIDAKYVTFVDSDDMLVSGAINKMLDIANITGADIIQGGYEVFDDDGQIKKTYIDDNKTSVNTLYGYPWGKLYKSTLFQNLAFPEKYWFEDTFTHMLINQINTNIAYYHNVAYRYRDNMSGITHASMGKPKIIDSFYITKCIMNDAVKLNIPIESLHKTFLLQVKTNYIRIASLHDEDINKAVFIETSKLYKKFYTDSNCEFEPQLRNLRQSLINTDYKRYILSLL